MITALLVFAVVWACGAGGGLAWYTHVHYGPVVYGNARWRHEAPLREAERIHREAVAALTETDREWLTARGWKPS